MEEFTKRVEPMGFSPHKMVGLMFHAMVRGGIRCDEVGGGSTFVVHK